MGKIRDEIEKSGWFGHKRSRFTHPNTICLSIAIQRCYNMYIYNVCNEFLKQETGIGDIVHWNDNYATYEDVLIMADKMDIMLEEKGLITP